LKAAKYMSFNCENCRGFLNQLGGCQQKRKGSTTVSLVIIGSVILGTNFILFVSNNIIFVYGAVILFAVGNGLMWPPFMSILSKGAVQGIAGSFGGLASIIGLITGGVLFNLIGVATFLVSAVVIFSVFIMSFRLLKTS
jgi:MFS transporter, DHA1 family, tetracycline resistance protein